MKKSVKDLFNSYVNDHVRIGDNFQPRQIGLYIRVMTGLKRNPYDGTITRYIRERREKLNDVMLISKDKSIYRKVNNA